MRIAYHGTGASLTDAALQIWVEGAQANISGVSSPGVLIGVSDPKLPYVWSDVEILADDRRTLGGKPYSRVHALLRRGSIELNSVSETEAALWAAWHSATLGGRIPFVLELPHDLEVVAVTADVSRVSRLVGYRRHEIAMLQLTEWTA